MKKDGKLYQIIEKKKRERKRDKDKLLKEKKKKIDETGNEILK